MVYNPTINRVVIEYNYLYDNLTDELKTTINGYYTAGYQVLVWYKYRWDGQFESLSSNDISDIMDFLSDNNISTTGFLLNFDENCLEEDLLLKSTLYIPER